MLFDDTDLDKHIREMRSLLLLCLSICFHVLRALQSEGESTSQNSNKQRIVASGNGKTGTILLFIGVSNMNIICGFSSAYLHSVSEPTGAKHVKTDGKAQQYSETHFAYVCLDQDTSVKNKIKHT